MELFDECFESYGDLSNRPADFSDFWSRQIAELRKVPLETETKRRISRKILSENNYALSFQSSGKFRIHGHFIAPKKLIGKPPLVIIFQDYLEAQTGYKGLTNAGIAQLTITLRGHADLELMKKKPAANPETDKNDSIEKSAVSIIKSPGYLQENLLSPEDTYIRNIYLDAYRTMEVARLRREIDSARIGVWGKGVGSAMAIMVASQMKRVQSLFLERPALCNIPLSLKHSTGVWSQEIRDGLKASRKNKTLIKKNMNYFDTLYFAESLSIPITMAVNLAETSNDPRSAFSLFHLLKDQKDMHLFTQDDSATKEKTKRSIAQSGVSFFKEQLLKKVASKSRSSKMK